MTAPHWHAYTYTGPRRPPDREARDPLVAAPPLVVAEWVGKPPGMMAATFTGVDDAVAWLEGELAAFPPLPAALGAATVLAYARERLAGRPGDQVTRYYTAHAYVVRDLVRCGPGSGVGRCPAPA